MPFLQANVQQYIPPSLTYEYFSNTVPVFRLPVSAGDVPESHQAMSQGDYCVISSNISTRLGPFSLRSEALIVQKRWCHMQLSVWCALLISLLSSQIWQSLLQSHLHPASPASSPLPASHSHLTCPLSSAPPSPLGHAISLSCCSPLETLKEFETEETVLQASVTSALLIL